MTSNIVKFVYQNKIREVKNPDPNETLLNYIRTKLKKTGTKEGCAEGGSASSGGTSHLSAGNHCGRRGSEGRGER